jgi:hypothetical protein
MLTLDDVARMLERYDTGDVATRDLVRWLDDAIGDDLLRELSPGVREALLALQNVAALYVPGADEAGTYYASESAVRSAVDETRARIALVHVGVRRSP